MIKEKNNSLFNENRKMEFLEDSIEKGIISEETAKSYSRIFDFISKVEEDFKKDVGEFSFKEMEKILYNFEAKNRNTLESYARIVSSYLNWCVQKKYAKNNYLSEFKPDDFEKYLINEEVYLTEKQLRRYEDKLANYQDAVILRLLFVGVGGKQLSEIRNLKKSDVQGNKLRLINTLKADKNGTPLKFTERFLEVDERTLSLICEAIKQKTYAKKNGHMSDSADNVRSFTDLVQSDYIIRASITKNIDNDWNVPSDKFVIYRRLQNLIETTNIGEITAKFIQRSGMMYFANMLIEDSDTIGLDDLKIIADRFNMNSYHNLKGFLNIENIRKTYPKNINKNKGVS